MRYALFLAVLAFGCAHAVPFKASHSVDSAIVGICASGGSEIYSSGSDWAKVRCTAAPPGIPSDSNGFALDWRDAISIVNGLRQVAFCITVEEQCGRVRWNHSNEYKAIAILNSGGDGQAWPEPTRDVPGDSTDWKALQDLKLRVVGVQWKDTNLAEGGRFTRTSSSPSTLNLMAVRPSLLFEWLQANLNASAKPLAILGSSGGSDAVISPLVLQSSLIPNITYLAPVSYPAPFWDLVSDCNGPTPQGTYVNPATGALGGSGAGVLVGSGEDKVDYVLATTACSTEQMTQQLAAGSGDKDALDAIVAAQGTLYTGKLHMLIGTSQALGSDVDNGVAWASGNLWNHAYFAGATRLWYESTTEGHGEPVSSSGPGFTQIYNELVLLLP